MATLRIPQPPPDEESMVPESAHNDERDKTDDSRSTVSRLAKDKNSILLLLFLYVLQGIPLGLASSVPLVLQQKKIGYRQQAMFSLVAWPFSIKLLWAPIVDSIYSRSFGRRKTWLIPTQYVIGLTMIFISYIVDDLMGNGSRAPSVMCLTLLFFLLTLFAATQDIAVDGWALTMLSRENVGYASTCNSVGQTAGYFLGYTIFLALESKEFCNAYLRWEPQETGVFDLSAFLFFWGLVFVAVTTCIWWFKQEKREAHAEAKTTIFSGYLQLLSVLKLPSVQSFAVAILTSKVSRYVRLMHTLTHTHSLSHILLTCTHTRTHTYARTPLCVVQLNEQLIH